MREEKIIKGIKLIRHNVCGVNRADDLSYPWRLDANFRALEFMQVAFMCLFGGTEEICVRGKTEEALKEFARDNHLYSHPRKISLKIWQPEAL